MSPVWKLCRAAALALAATLPAAAARGDNLDLSMPRTIVVGAPRGAAPSERLDGARTGRTRTSLPSSPVELWRRHVSGNIDVSPVVDATDAVIVALTIPEIVKIGPDARELWRARLGNAAALASPILLSDGTIAVVTSAGIAWGFTPAGALRFSTHLGVPRREADTAPLALSDGGFVVAAGNALVELDADGTIRARAVLDERNTAGERAVGAVVEGPDGALVTTASGSVYRFRPPAQPRKVGSFGGTVSRGAILADDRTLLAVVDGRRLVALDLPTGTAHVRTGGIALDGPPTCGPPESGPRLTGHEGGALQAPGGGLTFVGSQIGMLLGVDASGNERAHVMLDKALPISAAGAVGTSFLPTDVKPSPPVVVDASGRVAFVRGNGRAGVVAPSGRVEVVAERLCPGPIAVLPAGFRRLLFACHDGGLWMFGE
jgi:outer membrane protein assembly factor BamB